MSINFTQVFGSEIKVGFQCREPNNQYAGFPGAHGITGMMMGSRGYPIIITGQLRIGGANYRAARTAMIQLIANIEKLQFYAEQTYTYGDELYMYVVFEKLQLLDSNGKEFMYTSEGYCVTRFIAYFRSLL
jgi:gamma-glutamylcyclotransferase (GGCT)/AIG2-like uncharacterized protein YtfP